MAFSGHSPAASVWVHRWRWGRCRPFPEPCFHLNNSRALDPVVFGTFPARGWKMSETRAWAGALGHAGGLSLGRGVAGRVGEGPGWQRPDGSCLPAPPTPVAILHSSPCRLPAARAGPPPGKGQAWRGAARLPSVGGLLPLSAPPAALGARAQAGEVPPHLSCGWEAGALSGWAPSPALCRSREARVPRTGL